MMDIKEVEKAGCPRYVLHKLGRANIVSFSEFHFTKLDPKFDIDWVALGKHADSVYYRDHPEKMFFGKKLRELRLRHAVMGLHKFTTAMGTTRKVSEMYDIEHGYIPCPWSYSFSTQVRKVLGIPVDHEDWIELVRLAREPFVMQEMDEGVVVSHLVHKTDGTPLSEPEYRGLNAHINDIAKEHNKKAREFNGTE